ncbi:hypothetical protein F5146DRAFT_761574 [Armillaria mellea]|nr:hypothetical protein F5146DRAFT_761574 [Armillaria mellea]
MVVTEYMKNDPTAALQQLLMDFAAILRHRRFLGFGLGYLLGIVGSYRGNTFYTLSFYLGTLNDEGHVRHWRIDALNLASPAEMLRSYVWMINGLSSFIAYAETWKFESSAPRDLPKLSRRADCQDLQRLGQVKGSGGSHKRKRTNSQGRRSSDGGHETSDGGADNYMRVDKMDASGSGAEPEENPSEELMDNDYGQRMITMVDEDGIPYKIPHYTPSELARCVDEESDEDVVEARERIRAQQGEISSNDKTQRYLASLRMDGVRGS